MTVVDLGMPGWSLLAKMAPSKLILQMDESTYMEMGGRGWSKLDRVLAARPATTLRLYSSAMPFSGVRNLDSLEHLRYLDIADAGFASKASSLAVAELFPNLLGARIGDARASFGGRLDALNRVRELELHGSGWQLQEISARHLRALSLERIGSRQIDDLGDHSELSHLRVRSVRGLQVSNARSRFPRLASLRLQDISQVGDDSSWISDLGELVFLAAENVSWSNLPTVADNRQLEYLYLESNRRLCSLTGLENSGIEKLALIDQPGLSAGSVIDVTVTLRRLNSLRLGLGSEIARKAVHESLAVQDLGDWGFTDYVSPWLGV